MRTERGSVHAPATVLAWMAAAGLERGALVPIDGPSAVAAAIGHARC
jgi:hypothetical protein